MPRSGKSPGRRPVAGVGTDLHLCPAGPGGDERSPVDPPQGDDPAPTRHAFDLAPYLAALPLLQQRIGTVLTTPVLEAAWQSQPHCGTCADVDTCSRQASRLTTSCYSLTDAWRTPQAADPGAADAATAAGWLQAEGTHTSILIVRSRSPAWAPVRALTDNRLEVLTDTTSLYPGNIGTASSCMWCATRDTSSSASGAYIGVSRGHRPRLHAPGLPLATTGRRHVSTASSPACAPGGRRPVPAGQDTSRRVRGRRPPAVAGGDAGEF